LQPPFRSPKPKSLATFAQAVIKPPQAAAHCFALGAAPAGTFEPSTTTTEKASKITRSIWYLLCNRGRADRLEREHRLAPTGKSRHHVDRRMSQTVGMSGS